MEQKKQSVFEDVMDLTGMLPWWVGVVLALGAYLFLHHIAAAEILHGASLGQISGWAANPLLKSLASAFQYLLPLVFLGGAGLSAIDRWKRRKLHPRAADQAEIGSLRQMGWREFEMLVGEAFRQRGYAVVETVSGADGGIDLVLSRQGDKYLVRCKRWKRSNVPAQVVRELNGVMAAHGAKGGFVVTSGVYTREAKEFAKGQNIVLIEGEALVSMISGVNRQQTGMADPVKQTRKEPFIGPLDDMQIDTPGCPKCDSRIVRRRGQKGARAGHAFWGCSQFPKCRGTRSAL